jgi:hypothetical protein
MGNKHVILIASLTAICVCGCGDPYGFSKDFRLTTIDEAAGYATIELSGMGTLQPVSARPSDDYLVIRKYTYKSLTIYFRLLYSRRISANLLNPKRLIFSIDKQKYILPFLGSDKSDNNEWAWVTVEPVFLEQIAGAKAVNVSAEGSEETIQYSFNKKYLYFFKRFYKECVLPQK